MTFTLLMLGSVLCLAPSVLVTALGTDATNLVRNDTVADIYLRFYNGTSFDNHVDVQLGNAPDLLCISGFQPARSTVLYIHGYTENALKESVQVMVSAYLQCRPDTNMLLLDWSNMANGSYFFNAAPNTEKVGVAAAEQLKRRLDAGLSLEGLHVIGHSLGGQVAGAIGRELKDNLGYTLKRVTALDPAYPGFYPDGLLPHISASDAAFVDVIHTDAGGNGAPVATGTLDFWPNGGKAPQPGCPAFAPIPLTADNLCSHWRSWRFYAESVLRPDAFPANSLVDSVTSIINMGINANTSASGSYYLTTNSATPYGKGLAGLVNCITTTV